MKFKVKAGREFEIILETSEKKKESFFGKVLGGLAIFIVVGVFSAAAYGGVNGDYSLFEKITEMLYNILKTVIEGT